MDRRKFMSAVAMGAAGMALPGTASAEGQCAPICDAWGNCPQSYCSVGLPSGYVEFVAARQRSSQWCWAACIEMAFAARGFIIPQEVFVRETWGDMVNMPGQPWQIVNALNRAYVDVKGRRFQAQGDVLTVNLDTMIDDLLHRQTLIVGALGHATMLTGLGWVTDGWSKYVHDAVVRDPWPYQPSRRSLSAQEWFGIRFAVRIRCWGF